MGEFKKAISADGDAKVKTHIGGQALIEGVMMRGRYNWAVAVRQPDGSIYTEEHDLASGKQKNRWMYWPIIRGCRAFVESLMLGYKALNISAEHAYDYDEDEDEEQEQGEEQGRTASAGDALEGKGASEDAGGGSGEPAVGAVMTVSMILGLVLGIAIFVIVPAAISNLILGEAAMNGVAWNVLDGVLRVAIFIAYIWAISLMKDIHRLFSYHGAAD